MRPPASARPSFLGDVAAIPDVVAGLLADHRRLLDERVSAAARLIGAADEVVFAGMGSSLAAASAVLPRLHAGGRSAVAIDAGELLHAGLPGLVRDRPLVLVSQSGRSAEIAGLIDRLAGSGVGEIVGVTNDEASVLARSAAVVVPLFAGAEQAVATRTFAATLVVLHVLVDRVLGGVTVAPDVLAGAIEGMRAVLARPADRGDEAESAAPAASAGAPSLAPGVAAAAFGDAGSLMLLGRGPLLGIAAYAALTIKEAAHVHAEAMAGGAFRHGPLELAGPALGVVVLAGSGPTRPLELRMAADVVAAGSPTWLLDVGGAPGGCEPQPGVIHTDLGPLSPVGEQLVAATALQVLAAALARQAGHEPGVFRRGGKVTEVE